MCSVTCQSVPCVMTLVHLASLDLIIANLGKHAINSQATLDVPEKGMILFRMHPLFFYAMHLVVAGPP